MYKTTHGKLEKIIKNPFLTDIVTYSGIKLRAYQFKLAWRIINDFTKCFDDKKHKQSVEAYFRILQMGTGDGKTFLIQYILEQIIKVYIKKAKTNKGTIFVMAPRNQLLKVFIKDIEEYLIKGLNNDGIATRLYTSLDVGYSKSIKSFDSSLHAIKIVVLTDQMNLSRDISDEVDDLFLAIRDEGMAYDSDTPENAKELDGIQNATFKMHNKFNGMPVFKLVLNATPSLSQEEREKTKDIYIYKEDDERKWIKPIAMKPVIRYMDIKDKQAKIDLLNETIEDFIKFTLEFNYNKKFAVDHGLKISDEIEKFKPVAIVKATIDRFHYHYPVEEIMIDLINKDVKYAEERKEFKVTNYFTGEDEVVKYPGDDILGTSLLHPRICDQKNPYDMDNLVDYLMKDNILVVCDLGTYGINVPNLTHLVFLRPSERHPGRIGGAKQYYGRMERNLLIDDYNMAQVLVNTSCNSLKEFDFNLTMLCKMISKKIYIPHTVNNTEAAEKWESNLCDYDSKREDIKQILYDNDYMIPFQSKKKSGGTSKEFTWDDVRTAECSEDNCENPVLDLMINAYRDKKVSDFDAKQFAIQDVMQNAHILDKTGKVVCKCILCHLVETRLKNHNLPMGDSRRIA